MSEHEVIFIPGLRDSHIINRSIAKAIPPIWRLHGIQVHVMQINWEEGSFNPKLKKITSKIDELADQGKIVSLMGMSAGGGAAGNAFGEKRDSVNGFVDVTGRLRAGENVKPTLEWASRNSKAFKESVTLFERETEPSLSISDRERIMTIRPFYDEIVPPSTVPVAGATNLVAPFPEHSLGGSLIMTAWAKKIIHFLNGLIKTT